LNLVDNVEVAFVFGSMASGEQHSGSDIDICVLGDGTLMEVVKALSTAQEQLQREMNPVVMTTKTFQTSRLNRTAL
jgi:predicted nucleotidyltransferase